MTVRILAAALALLPLFGCAAHDAGGILPVTVSTGGGSVHTDEGAAALPGGGTAVCPKSAEEGTAQCPLLVNTTIGWILNTIVALTGAVPGLHPADLRSAYNLPSTGGSGSTVAVIAKGDDPNAESDLAVYRSRFGLAPCTTANGCFRKVNEQGKASPMVAGDQQWSQEIAIDLDMVSAICPNCHILLVESNTNVIADFGTSVNTAVRLGATEISNSYYTNEWPGIVQVNPDYDHPGIPITVAAGDNGYGTTFPASSPYVIAVGGTTLVRNPSTSRGWSESVWGDTGSGCSVYFAKPSWQHDTGCSKRTVADVAVVADPANGVAAYNTYAPSGEQGWAVYGGTSVGAPIVAAIYALAGNGASAGGAASLYANPSALNPVTVGSDGTCTPAYLCTAVPGYNGPTGMGTPNGLGAF